MAPRRRVVVTGLGCINASGTGHHEMWQNLLAGNLALGPIDAFATDGFPVHRAGVVRGYEPATTIAPKVVNQTDRHTQFGLTATSLAIEDAALDLATEDRNRIGVVVGNNLGGNVFGEEQLFNMYRKGARTVSPYQSIAWFYAATPGQATIAFGLKGYSKTHVADRAGSLLALGDAFRVIQRGENDIVFAGGCEAPITPYSLVAYLDAGVLARADGPQGERYAPFDRHRCGTTIGEGGAFLVLEERERALRRGARIHAEVAGLGQTTDGYDPVLPAADGHQYARAITLALREARVDPGDVRYVSVDGVGGVLEDAREARAIRQAFGDATDGLLVSCPKTMFGHSFGAATAFDAAIACLAIEHGSVPPTVGDIDLDPVCELPLVRGSAVTADVGCAVVLATARGGVNGAMVFRRHGSTH